MKTLLRGIVLITCQSALPMAEPQAAAPAPLVLASVESRWEHVYCDLTELKRTATGELSVRFHYRNGKQAAHPLPHANIVQLTRALDPVNRALFSVLKDASGKPVSSTPLDGAAARPVPADGVQAHWARLQAPPEDVPAVVLLVEGCLPFEDVEIGAAPSTHPLAGPSPALASQESESPGVVVELTRLSRRSGEFVTLTFRYRNTGLDPYRFPHQRLVRSAYFLDNANRRKYEVVRDQEQQPICSEILGLASQTGDTIPPGGALTLWAKFPAPPADTTAVTVLVPFAPPFDDVAIAGAGGAAAPAEAGAAAASAGTAVAGSVVGVEAALKDLGATVTPTAIRIALAADVLFDFDKVDLKPEAQVSLGKVATVLNAHSGARVVIEGHTDSKGADAYNQTLSEQRAASVREWLVANSGLDGGTISTHGWGETRPVAHNTRPDGSDDPEGRARNRRVEIVVSKGG